MFSGIGFVNNWTRSKTHFLKTKTCNAMKKPNFKFTKILLIVLGIIVAAIISFHTSTFHLSEVHNLGQLNITQFEESKVMSALKDQVLEVIFLIIK